MCKERHCCRKGDNFGEHVQGNWDGRGWIGEAKQSPDGEEQEHTGQQEEGVSRQLHGRRKREQSETQDLHQKERQKEEQGVQDRWGWWIGSPHDEKIEGKLKDHRCSYGANDGAADGYPESALARQVQDDEKGNHCRSEGDGGDGIGRS